MIEQPLIIPVKESGQVYELFRDYRIDLTPFGLETVITIKKGFTYDGASVHRWLWSLSGLTPDGYHRPAALVHDYLYERRGRILGTVPSGQFKGTIKRTDYTRKGADKVFRSMLKHLSIADHRIYLAYKAVRLAGGFYWSD